MVLWYQRRKETTPPDGMPPDINPDEEAARADAASETQPPETEDAPMLQWKVDVHCVIAFKPDVLLPAWKTRLPTVPISIDFVASTNDTSVFDVVAYIGASSNAGACSMASGLLKRHFQTIEILDMEAQQA